MTPKNQAIWRFTVNVTFLKETHSYYLNVKIHLPTCIKLLIIMLTLLHWRELLSQKEVNSCVCACICSCLCVPHENKLHRNWPSKKGFQIDLTIVDS